jgi:hypothetical protein
MERLILETEVIFTADETIEAGGGGEEELRV